MRRTLLIFGLLLGIGCSGKPLPPVEEIAPVVGEDGAPKTFFWDGEFLKKNRGRIQELQPALKLLLTEARSALAVEPFSVTHKQGYEGDPHDFHTLSPYFWPNTILPGGKPYWFRDGEVNPEAETERYDRTRYLNFLRTLQKLSLAYYFSGEEKFAERAAHLLRVWFLNLETRMNPHFEHAQAIPGLVKGFSLGVIRGTELIQILDTVRLIESSPSWQSEDEAGLKEWFEQYLNWASNHVFGRREARMKNNHGTWYDAHTAAVALFVQKPEIAREIILSRSPQRIQTQITPEGQQLYELKRSDPWVYSVYNLTGLFALAKQASAVGLDLWNYRGTQGQTVRGALDYLIPFALGEKKWPYGEIPDTSEWLADFVSLLAAAGKRYGEPRYFEVIHQLPALPENHRVWLLTNLSVD